MASRCLLAALLLVSGRAAGAQPLSLLDVPYISQSEALCGGAAAAMVLRYWGVQGLTAESFATLVDRSAAGIRTDVLTADIRGRGFRAFGVEASEAQLAAEIGAGRPVIALVEDRPGTFHYVVVVAWHERAVVFHDPARAPYQVMPPENFRRRWERSRRWMLVILPPETREGSVAHATPPAVSAPLTAPSSCEALLASGVSAAQDNQLERAERELSEAISCDGSAAYRELAGVRLIQRRWGEVETLAAAAVRLNPADSYAWKLLGTARYVSDRPADALAAWNHTGEPRVDLIRVQGLSRTRQRVVEDAMGVRVGEVLRPEILARARRRLSEVPAFALASVRYTPTAGGAADLVASVVERPVLPRGALPIAVVGARTVATRELMLPIASPFGGGDRLSISWRFWPNRPRYALGYDVPGRWGTTWQVAASRERQPFTNDLLPAIDRTSAGVSVARWQTAGLRWEAGAGMDRWRGRDTYAVVAAGLRVSFGRWGGSFDARTWNGRAPFSLTAISASWTSSRLRTGPTVTVRTAAEAVTSAAPADLWRGGDTGSVRPTLLRAHPLLENGRLRAERLGRGIESVSADGEWWLARGPLRFAPAVFLDTARTSRMFDGSSLTDTDAGVGVRAALPGLPGTIRLDVARGFRDGVTALSLVYEP